MEIPEKQGGGHVLHAQFLNRRDNAKRPNPFPLVWDQRYGKEVHQFLHDVRRTGK